MKTKERERKPASRRGSTAGNGTGKTVASSGRTRTAARPAADKQRRTAAPEPVRGTPDVVYIPPKPFNRSRFALRLVTVVAVVLALMLGVSVFFKVDYAKIRVSGNEKYTVLDILQAAGIQDGDNLLTFSRARASGRIITSLPYVAKVRIGIKLPDTVMIDITEVEVTYAVKAADDTWWLVSSGGKVIEKAGNGAQRNCTRILGVRLDAPEAGSQAVALETGGSQTDADGNTVPVVTTQAQRLKTALNITEYLELNGIIGKATSVDVNDLGNIQLWYGDQYQVKLGNDTQLSYKISWMKSAVDQLAAYESGVLDITLTVKPDGVLYTSFD